MNAPESKPYKILAIDDEPENLRIYLNILKQENLHRDLLMAPNGKIGYHLAYDYLPDLIITDWEMPEMSGLKLAENLKNNPKTKDIPILMVTGRRKMYEDMKLAFKYGVVGFLHKPIYEEQFINKVKTSLTQADSIKELRRMEDLLDGISG